MGSDDALDLMIVDQLGDAEELLALGADRTTHVVGDEGQILGAQLHQLLHDPTAADTVIAECEYIVPVGDIEPENIHTYGMCVDYIVEGDRK